MSFYFTIAINIYFHSLCQIAFKRKKKDHCWLNITLTHFAWMCRDWMCLSWYFYFLCNVRSVHVCRVMSFILHGASFFYSRQCRQGVMASFKTQLATFPHIVSGFNPLHGSWLSVNSLQGGGRLFKPLHRPVSVKCHCEPWSACVCCNRNKHLNVLLHCECQTVWLKSTLPSDSHPRPQS